MPHFELMNFSMLASASDMDSFLPPPTWSHIFNT